MAGIIGIYGLVVSVLISDGLKQELPLYTGFIQFGAGLAVGLAGLAAGFAIGIVGDAGVRGTAQQPRLFVGMILILIFAEVLGKSRATSNTQPYCVLFRCLTNATRSVRPHCCPAHELQGHPRHCLPVSGICDAVKGGPTTCTYQQEALFLASIGTHQAHSEQVFNISNTLGVRTGYLIAGRR